MSGAALAGPMRATTLLRDEGTIKMFGNSNNCRSLLRYEAFGQLL